MATNMEARGTTRNGSLSGTAHPNGNERAQLAPLIEEDDVWPAGVRSHLTNRELEILALVAKGYSNKLIANRLAISERTVKNHLFYIMTKLRAMDRTHAVVIAIRDGWLSL